jgi:hypothetical protein
MLQHRDSYPVLVVGRRGDKEPMQEFINDAFDVVTDLHLICGRKMQCAACLHGQFSDLRVLIVKKIKN